MLFSIPHCASTPVLAHQYSQRAVQPYIIHQYSPPTWVENLAVRPNGYIIPITTTSSVLNQIDPSTGKLYFLHDFKSAGNAIQSIAEVVPDLFVVNVLTCAIVKTLSCTANTSSIWKVDLRQYSTQSPKSSPVILEITKFPQAGFLNGAAGLNDHEVLFADSFLGGIWKLHVNTGVHKLLFTDPSMMGTASVATGINGLRVRPGNLFYTNSAKGTFTSIPINPRTGNKIRGANATVITTGLIGPDDLEVDIDINAGNDSGRDKKKTTYAYLANGVASQLIKIDIQTGAYDVMVSVPGPTSARWAFPITGRDRFQDEKTDRRLYVSTNGGLKEYITGNFTIGGAVYRVDV